MKYVRILFYPFIALLLFLTACGNQSIESNMNEEVKDFDFITQDKDNFNLEDLKGDWWLAYFMYTECTQVCPTTTANMLKIESMLEENNLDAQIVSFSVDPENDTPASLRNYVAEHQINLDRWTLLTGYEFDTIQDFSAKSFKVNVDQGSPGEVEFAHSTNFFLINPDGQVIKKYDGMGTEEIDIIIEDLKKVL